MRLGGWHKHALMKYFSPLEGVPAVKDDLNADDNSKTAASVQKTAAQMSSKKGKKKDSAKDDTKKKSVIRQQHEKRENLMKDLIAIIKGIGTGQDSTKRDASVGPNPGYFKALSDLYDNSRGDVCHLKAFLRRQAVEDTYDDYVERENSQRRDELRRDEMRGNNFFSEKDPHSGNWTLPLAKSQQKALQANSIATAEQIDFNKLQPEHQKKIEQFVQKQIEIFQDLVNSVNQIGERITEMLRDGYGLYFNPKDGSCITNQKKKNEVLRWLKTVEALSSCSVTSKSLDGINHVADAKNDDMNVTFERNIVEPIVKIIGGREGQTVEEISEKTEAPFWRATGTVCFGGDSWGVKGIDDAKSVKEIEDSKSVKGIEDSIETKSVITTKEIAMTKDTSEGARSSPGSSQSTTPGSSQITVTHGRSSQKDTITDAAVDVEFANLENLIDTELLALEETLNIATEVLEIERTKLAETWSALRRDEDLLAEFESCDRNSNKGTGKTGNSSKKTGGEIRIRDEENESERSSERSRLKQALLAKYRDRDEKTKQKELFLKKKEVLATGKTILTTLKTKTQNMRKLIQWQRDMEGQIPTNNTVLAAWKAEVKNYLSQLDFLVREDVGSQMREKIGESLKYYMPQNRTQGWGMQGSDSLKKGKGKSKPFTVEGLEEMKNSLLKKANEITSWNDVEKLRQRIGERVQRERVKEIEVTQKAKLASPGSSIREAAEREKRTQKEIEEVQRETIPTADSTEDEDADTEDEDTDTEDEDTEDEDSANSDSSTGRVPDSDAETTMLKLKPESLERLPKLVKEKNERGFSPKNRAQLLPPGPPTSDNQAAKIGTQTSSESDPNLEYAEELSRNAFEPLRHQLLKDWPRFALPAFEKFSEHCEGSENSKGSSEKEREKPRLDLQDNLSNMHYYLGRIQGFTENIVNATSKHMTNGDDAIAYFYGMFKDQDNLFRKSGIISDPDANDNGLPSMSSHRKLGFTKDERIAMQRNLASGKIPKISVGSSESSDSSNYSSDTQVYSSGTTQDFSAQNGRGISSFKVKQTTFDSVDEFSEKFGDNIRRWGKMLKNNWAQAVETYKRKRRGLLENFKDGDKRFAGKLQRGRSLMDIDLKEDYQRREDSREDRRSRIKNEMADGKEEAEKISHAEEEERRDFEQVTGFIMSIQFVFASMQKAQTIEKELGEKMSDIQGIFTDNGPNGNWALNGKRNQTSLFGKNAYLTTSTLAQREKTAKLKLGKVKELFESLIENYKQYEIAFVTNLISTRVDSDVEDYRMKLYESGWEGFYEKYYYENSHDHDESESSVAEKLESSADNEGGWRLPSDFFDNQKEGENPLGETPLPNRADLRILIETHYDSRTVYRETRDVLNDSCLLNDPTKNFDFPFAAEYQNWKSEMETFYKKKEARLEKYIDLVGIVFGQKDKKYIELKVAKNVAQFRANTKEKESIQRVTKAITEAAETEKECRNIVREAVGENGVIDHKKVNAMLRSSDKDAGGPLRNPDRDSPPVNLKNPSVKSLHESLKKGVSSYVERNAMERNASSMERNASSMERNASSMKKEKDKDLLKLESAVARTKLEKAEIPLRAEETQNGEESQIEKKTAEQKKEEKRVPKVLEKARAQEAAERESAAERAQETAEPKKAAAAEKRPSNSGDKPKAAAEGDKAATARDNAASEQEKTAARLAVQVKTLSFDLKNNYDAKILAQSTSLDGALNTLLDELDQHTANSSCAGGDFHLRNEDSLQESSLSQKFRPLLEKLESETTKVQHDLLTDTFLNKREEKVKRLRKTIEELNSIAVVLAKKPQFELSLLEQDEDLKKALLNLLRNTVEKSEKVQTFMIRLLKDENALEKAQNECESVLEVLSGSLNLKSGSRTKGGNFESLFKSEYDTTGGPSAHSNCGPANSSSSNSSSQVSIVTPLFQLHCVSQAGFGQLKELSDQTDSGATENSQKELVQSKLQPFLQKVIVDRETALVEKTEKARLVDAEKVEALQEHLAVCSSGDGGPGDEEEDHCGLNSSKVEGTTSAATTSASKQKSRSDKKSRSDTAQQQGGSKQDNLQQASNIDIVASHRTINELQEQLLRLATTDNHDTAGSERDRRSLKRKTENLVKLLSQEREALDKGIDNVQKVIDSNSNDTNTDVKASQSLAIHGAGAAGSRKHRALSVAVIGSSVNNVTKQPGNNVSKTAAVVTRELLHSVQDSSRTFLIKSKPVVNLLKRTGIEMKI